MKLSICIVNFKARDYLVACLESLRKFAPDCSHEIIVVDNNSQDGSVEIIKEKYPEVLLIINQQNEGFARANNRAILRASGEYILLLNPDTRVTANALHNLLTVAEATKNLGTLGGSLIYPDGRTQPSSYRYPGIWSELRKLLFLEKISEQKAITNARYPVDWSCGAFLLFPRKINGLVTQMDPAIFLYSEDLELCWRLRLKGRKNYMTGVATIIHEHNKSGEQRFGAKSSESRLIEFRKTIDYVTQLRWRGPAKKIRFWLFRKLVALNDYWRIFLLSTIFRSKYAEHERLCRIAEHRATAKVFSE